MVRLGRRVVAQMGQIRRSCKLLRMSLDEFGQTATCEVRLGRPPSLPNANLASPGSLPKVNNYSPIDELEGQCSGLAQISSRIIVCGEFLKEERRHPTFDLLGA